MPYRTRHRAARYHVVHALVAQRIEHLTSDQAVGSSNLSERAYYPSSEATLLQ